MVGGWSITAVGHSERRSAARRGASETFPASHFHNPHARQIMQRFISDSPDNCGSNPARLANVRLFLKFVGIRRELHPDGRHYAQVRNANLNIWCVCALTALGPGTTPSLTRRSGERSVYIYRKCRCAPSFGIGARSDLQPAILQSRVRGTESATRQLLDKVSLCAGISSGSSARAGVGRAEHRFHTFKNYIFNYTPPIRTLQEDWLTRAEDISGGPNMTVQCKG